MSSDTEQTTEQIAWEAVRKFRRLAPQFSAFASALLKRQVKVEAGKQGSYTDGNIIYIMPPFDLGKDVAHLRGSCRRTDERGIQLCPACKQDDELTVSIYHEIGHLLLGTFEGFYGHQARWLRGMGLEWNVPKGARLCDAMPYVDPWLAKITNILDDVRIDGHLRRERPGLARMSRVSDEAILAEGPKNRLGEAEPWQTRDIHSQLLALTCFLPAGYRVDLREFDPELEPVLTDPQFRALTGDVDTLPDFASTFRRAVELWLWFKSKGFFLTEEDFNKKQQQDEEEAAKQAQQQSDDAEAAEQEEREREQESGLNKPGEHSSEADDSGEGSSEGSRPDAGDSDADTDGEPSSDRSDSDEDSADADGDGEGGSDEGDPSDQAEGESDGAEGSGGGQPGDDESTGDAPGPDSDSEPDGSGSGDDADDSAGGGSEEPGSGSPTEGDSTDEGGSDGDSEGESADAADDLRASDEGTGTAQSDEAGGSPTSASGPDEAPVDDGLDGPLSDDGADDGAQHGADASGPSAGDVGPDNGPTEADGDLADDRTAAEKYADYMRRHGGIDEVDEDLQALTHGQDGDLDYAQQEENERKAEALKAAVTKSADFDEDTRKVTGLKRFTRDGNSWAHNYEDDRFSVRMEKILRDRVHPERISPAIIAGPAARLKRLFEDNDRSRYEKNLTRGRVNSRSLGRRAPVGDERLFQKRAFPKKKDYFVVVMLDLSGSAAGEVLDQIKRAVYAQCEMLSRVGVPFAVVGHSSLAPAGIQNYSLRTMTVAEVKTEREPWDADAKERLFNLAATMNNLDGHAMEFARKVCEKSTAEKRIILYYTDGEMPAFNAGEELPLIHREMEICKRLDITIAAVGVENDSPKKFGFPTVLYRGETDIPAVVDHIAEQLAAV